LFLERDSIVELRMSFNLLLKDLHDR
jgi:hypothetical protein